MKVRIGTRIGEIFAECGGFTGKPRRIASGSPLLGHSVADLDEPVIKTSYAVFAILEQQVGGTVTRNCIGCGECRAVCPVGLDPEALFKGLGKGAPAGEAAVPAGKLPGTPPRGGGPGKLSGAFLGKLPTDFPAGLPVECHGCGCCEVVCPSRLPLSTAIVNSVLRGY
jgi:electron transport complex protein RnfC